MDITEIKLDPTKTQAQLRDEFFSFSDIVWDFMKNRDKITMVDSNGPYSKYSYPDGSAMVSSVFHSFVAKNANKGCWCPADWKEADHTPGCKKSMSVK